MPYSTLIDNLEMHIIKDYVCPMDVEDPIFINQPRAGIRESGKNHFTVTVEVTNCKVTAYINLTP